MMSVLSAVKVGNIPILRVLLQVPQTLSETDLERSLIYCAKEGLLECAQCVIQAGVDVNCEDASGNRPLHHSIASRSDALVRLLLESGAKPNVLGSSRNYPLHIAAKANMDEAMEHLIKHGARLDSRDSAGQTPLIAATRERRFFAVNVLLDNGCGLDCQDNSGRTALHYASQLGNGVDPLLSSGANPNICDNHNCTPLLLAATEGFSHVVKLLCKANCDPNIANEVVNKTPLHILSSKGHWECIDDLLCAGADVNLRDSRCRSPLWYAVDNSRVDVVRLLLKSNSQVDTYQCGPDDPIDACPVRLAVTKGDVHVLKMFMMTGFDAQHLRDSLQSSELSERLAEDLSRWLHHANDVMTLKQACRRWIRHHSGNRLLLDITTLPIPSGLRNFLLLKELDEVQVSSSY